MPRDYDLNELGNVGRMAIDRIDESHLYAEALLFILRVFNRIRELLEAKNGSRDSVTAYSEVFEQIQSFKKWMEDESKKNDSIEKEYFYPINQFKYSNIHPKHL